MADPDDEHHVEAEKFRLPTSSIKVVPDVVLTEACYMIGRFISHKAMMYFLQAFSMSDAQLEPVSMDDLKRAYEIMAAYADVRLDFVDCCIMALAERLNIVQICTFDRRDFFIFRPTHCEYLELLP
jgi:predicted nucleic acid-binding protein